MDFSKKITSKKINEIIKIFDQYKTNIRNSNILFSFKIFETHITIYKTNKIHFQGKDIQKAIQTVFNNENELQLTKNKLDNKEKKFQIGSDEVGVGDYFGGITVCAVLINTQNDIDFLHSIKVKDSKKINTKQINLIANKLKKNIKYMIANVNPEQYNKMYDKYKNAHIIKTYLHNEAINSLIQKNKILIKDCQIIIDQFVNQKKYEEYLEIIKPKTKIKIDLFETKSESKYLSIAAASILARNYWLNEIKKIEKLINSPIQLGATDKKIFILAKKIYNTKGKNFLNKCVKMHFNFTKNIIE